MSILRRTLRHPSAVILLNVGAQSGIRMVSNILLAQLLAPAAFALTSITMLILTGIHMATDVGIAVMTLRHGPMSRDDQDRMWTMQFVRGLVLGVLMIALAVPVSRLYGSPDLAGVMIAISLMTILQGGQSLYPVIRLAERDLIPTLWIDVGARALGALVSVLAALVSPTVWALVTGMLVQAVFANVVSHVLARQGLPRFRLDMAFVRSHWMFSRWIQLGSTLTFIAMQIDKALFPFFYGLPLFGVYGIGATFAQIPGQITQKWSANVFYPLMIQKIRGGDDGRAVLRRIRLTMLLFTAAIAAGTAAIAPSFFYLLYKPAYHDAARFAALLTVAVYFDLAESSLRHFPLADTTARYEFIAVIVRLAVFLSLLAAIVVGHGDAYLYAAAYTCGQAASCLFMLWVCTRRGYVRPGVDILLTAAMGGVLLVAYVAPMLPGSKLEAVGQGGAFASLSLLVIGAIYLRRGLPSLPHEPAEQELETQARELQPDLNAAP